MSRFVWAAAGFAGIDKWTLLALVIFAPWPVARAQPVIAVENRVLNPVDARLFGHFMERPSWGGEIGVEAAVDPATGRLQKSVLQRLKEMEIPVLRFPGGTDADLMDWTDMIDRAPGRAATERPGSVGHTGGSVSNRFGIDEALGLAEELGAEMVLVVNFAGACYYGGKPVADAARHAAGLLAYANASIGSALPEGMVDWPAIRAQNGRSEPYGARYVQIANEPWIFDSRLRRTGAVADSLADRYFACMNAYVDAFRAVDPRIEIIVDGNSEALVGRTRDELGDRVNYVAYHIYQPWAISEVTRDDTPVSPRTLTDEEIWKAWVATPGVNAAGESALTQDVYQFARASGYPVAVTEWNWNGWWGIPEDERGDILNSKFAQGVGAAGFLHAFMREGHNIPMALQSMLVGRSWGITGIRVDSSAKSLPYLLPTGQVTDFYAKRHGSERLAISTINVPVYEQPYRMGDFSPKERVVELDVVATREGETVYVHAINRRFDKPTPVTIDLSAFPGIIAEVEHHLFQGTLDNTPFAEGSPDVGGTSTRTLPVENHHIEVELPQRSVSILAFRFSSSDP